MVTKGRHHCCGWVSLTRKKGAGCLERGRERVVVCEGEVGGGLVVVVGWEGGGVGGGGHGDKGS